MLDEFNKNINTAYQKSAIRTPEASLGMYRSSIVETNLCRKRLKKKIGEIFK